MRRDIVGKILRFGLSLMQQIVYKDYKPWLISNLMQQNSYLFTYNTFIKILYMFRTLPCSSSGGLRRNCIYMQPLVSSLSAGDCPVHQLRKNLSSRFGFRKRGGGDLLEVKLQAFSHKHYTELSGQLQAPSVFNPGIQTTVHFR